MTNENRENRSITSLLSDLVNDLKVLMRQEILLAKAEFSDGIGQISSAGVSLAVGGAILFAGFLVLLYCAVLALANVVAPWLAALIVGLVVAGVGGILLLKGRSNLKSANLIPERSMESLRRDKDLVKGHAGS